MLELQKQFQHATIIRRLKEFKFRFLKPRHIQKLKLYQKFNRYNFAVHILKYHRDHLLSIIFSDESRFCNDPDNQCHWIRNDDFREEMYAKYEKFKFGTMVWAAIGYGFNSQLIFPQ